MISKALWFKLHSWVGVNTSILLCFIALTGSFALISSELDWLSNSAKRVSPESVDTVNWLAIYSRAQQKIPQHPIRSIEAPPYSWFSAEVIYEKDNKERHRLFFHPSTGQYLGEGRWLNWQRFFRMLHRHVMLPVTLGITLVGLLAVSLVIVLISSLYFYKNWWRYFFRFPNLHNKRTRWADIHKLIGVWSLLFLLIISITGCWYLAERWGAKATYPNSGKPVTLEAKKNRIMPSIEQFSLMLDQTDTYFPALKIQAIEFPRKAGELVEIQGQAQAILVRPRANFVAFDPVSSQIITQHNALDLSFHARISEAADPIHFGQWGGLFSKSIHLIFGILLIVLTATGTYRYGMRIARLPRKQQRVAKQIWVTVFKQNKVIMGLSLLGIIIAIGYGATSFII